MLAAEGWPSWPVVGWIVVAMVGARSAAMGFNRLADRHIDAANPRTIRRELPAGKVSPGFVAAFVAVSAALLVLAAWRLNPLALKLSPLALVILLGYSFTKRFTSASHLFLGLALSGAPLGAWIAALGFRFARKGHLRPRSAFLMGALIGFGMVTKLSAFVFAPWLFWLLFQVAATHRRCDFRLAGLILLGALATSGTYWVWNQVTYGHPLQNWVFQNHYQKIDLNAATPQGEGLAVGVGDEVRAQARDPGHCPVVHCPFEARHVSCLSYLSHASLFLLATANPAESL